MSGVQNGWRVSVFQQESSPRSTISDVAIVQAAADGKKSHEMVQELGLTHNVVRTRLFFIRKIHNCKTTAQLVAHFIRNGWID